MSHGGDVIVDHNLNHWVVGQNFVFFFLFFSWVVVVMQL